MIEKTDKIGIVRQHRWLSAAKQAEVLKPRCRTVVSLGGGDLLPVKIEDVEKWAAKGTVFELVHAFLLVDAKPRRRTVALKSEFRSALAKIEKRGAAVVDVDAGICSTKHRKSLLALVDSDIARSQKGSKSATNGAQSKGRPTYNPTMQELKDAKAIWRDLIEYPEWKDADAALKANVSKKFTAWRAHDLWGPRTGKRR